MCFRACTLINIRKFQRKDREPIKSILVETDVFTTEEISIAMELADVFLTEPNQKDYDLYVAVEENDTAIGYTCFGPTALTDGTFDLYWIAVKPSFYRHGAGKALLKFTEKVVRDLKGRLIVAETSSQPKYENTRKFYLKNEYKEVARISNYYKVGDDLVVYGKYVSQLGAI
jgi:ribosomal protein S18 acetylase RimI-like enzyme